MFSARNVDRMMRGLIWTTGLFVVTIILAVVFFLGRESKFAFDQSFGSGYRFSVTATEVAPDYDVAFDPNSAVIAFHPEGGIGLDEKEEMAPAPTLEMLAGSPGGITSTQTPPNQPLDPANFTKEDWRPLLKASEGATSTFLAYATPEATGEKLVLRWKPDIGFSPAYAPHRITLKVLKVPEGVAYDGPMSVDLKANEAGSLSLPMWRAPSDDAIKDGYLLAYEVQPDKDIVAATLSNIFRTTWGPTTAYAQYGMLPLILSTLAMTILAALFATPIAVWLAVYMNELAPPGVANRLKPMVELLGNIPTVVLGYFGIVLLAPALQGVFRTDSGRMMLTAAIMTAILIIPLIATFADDALHQVPDTLRDGGQAIGLTPGEVVRQVVLPAARPGLIGAALIGFARAFGETMIIWMLAGGTPNMPGWNPFNIVRTPSKGIADAIYVDMQNVVPEDAHYGHLFLLGIILFLITLTINLIGYRFAKRNVS